MRICSGCSQKFTDTVKKCKYCGKETYEFKEKVKVTKKEPQKFGRCRVCGQLLQKDAERCKYCGGGIFIETDPKIKKNNAQIVKKTDTARVNSQNIDNNSEYTEQDRIRFLEIARNIGLNPHANTGVKKLANMILAKDPNIVLENLTDDDFIDADELKDKNVGDNNSENDVISE